MRRHTKHLVADVLPNLKAALQINIRKSLKVSLVANNDTLNPLRLALSKSAVNKARAKRRLIGRRHNQKTIKIARHDLRQPFLHIPSDKLVPPLNKREHLPFRVVNFVYLKRDPVTRSQRIVKTVCALQALAFERANTLHSVVTVDFKKVVASA